MFVLVGCVGVCLWRCGWLVSRLYALTKYICVVVVSVFWLMCGHKQDAAQWHTAHITLIVNSGATTTTRPKPRSLDIRAVRGAGAEGNACTARNKGRHAGNVYINCSGRVGGGI